MAKYKVAIPNEPGKFIILEGPEGASKDVIRAKAKELYAAKQGQPTTEPEAATKPDFGEMGTSEVLSRAGRNLIPSTVSLIGDLYEAVTNPVETVTTLSQVIGGGMRKGLKNLGIDVGERPDSEEKFEAVVNEMSKKYGTIEGFKEALATDPASILADASAVVTGGALATAKTVGTTTRAGQKAASIAEKAALIDPLTATATATGKLTTAAVGKAAPAALAFTSGVGRKSIEKAYESGVEGGAALKNFRDNLKEADPQLILDDALANLEKLRQKKNADYKAGMKKISDSGSKVMYNRIDYVLSQVAKEANKLSDGSMDTINALLGKVKQSKEMGYNTVMQMDDLKQAIREIGESSKTNAGKVYAEKVRKSVVKAIDDVAPDYSSTMETYGKAAEAIKELKNTLSLEKNPDTALRKLLSVMRDNVQTNYGKRASLVELLETGGTEVMSKIAGQELSSVLPRGILGRMLGGGAVGFGAATGGLGGLLTPGAIPAIAVASPRIIGEAAQLTGQARRKAQKAAQVLPSGTFSQITAAQRITEMAEEEER